MKLILTLAISVFSLTSYSLEKKNITKPKDDINKNITLKKRNPKHYYGYFNRHHEMNENLKHLAAIYGVTWAIYPLTQPGTVQDKGSWKNYKRNFAQVVFDKDEPFWNWFVHPLSGSQLFLYYRANGYSRTSSLAMAAISSTLFEFTVEIYTEPASVQDLYQTPILGAILGVGIENLSMYLLNTGIPLAKFFAHLINPSTLFWFYEGKVNITPDFTIKNGAGLNISADF